MNRTEKINLYVQFLEYCHDLSEADGKVSSVTSIAKEFGVSYSYITKGMQNLGILEKKSGKGVWVWKSTAKPNRIMASELMEELSKISKSHNYRYLDKKNSAAPDEPRNLVSVEQFKRQANLEARRTLIRAIQSAQILGINLLSLDEETIDKYVESQV